MDLARHLRAPAAAQRSKNSRDQRRVIRPSLALIGWLAIAAHTDSSVGAQDKGATPVPRAVELSDEAREIAREALLVDGHNDLPWAVRELGASFDQVDIRQPQPKLHTDIPRLREGGLKAQFWSVYVPASTDLAGTALLQTMEQVDLVHAMIERYPDVFELVRTADDIERIVQAGKIASMIGVEGGYSIENSLAVLHQLYARGARYMTLTHSKTIAWADSATDEPKHGGLTPFGEDVVREMNRIGMLVDISHVSPETMLDALRVTRAPVIFSHSSARAICDHPRNVSDDVLRLLPENGGVVMVNFFSGFVVPMDQQKADKARRGTVQDVVDHIDHIVKVAGIDHVGIGSDFDGIPRTPRQLDDVAHYPYITQELLNRGYQREQIEKILGQNLLRALKRTEDVARELRRVPSP
jgi:membrane dipeptidase